MNVGVWTGQTKAPPGTVLLPVVLGDKKTDRVFLLLHTEGRSEKSDTLKEECVSILTHAVLESEGGGYERLESALKELNGLLKGFLLSNAVRDVHAVVGLLEQDGMLHLSHVGRAEAYVVREGVATQVTEYTRGKPPTAFVHIVSGPAQAKDHFILSTQRLLRALTPAQLVQIVQHAGETAIQSVISTLSSEQETACILHLSILEAGDRIERTVSSSGRPAMPRIRANAKKNSLAALSGLIAGVGHRMDWSSFLRKIRIPGRSKTKGTVKEFSTTLGKRVSQFLTDLYDPERKRRAHLLLLAGGAALFLVIWVAVQLSLSSQRNQTKGELATLVQQINADLSTAENRQLAGDIEMANTILERAEDRARQVMDNESGLFRSEAIELINRIKSKRDEMNRVFRDVLPRVMAVLSAKNPDIIAQGLIGLPNGEFLVYDRQDLYRVSLNTVEGGERLSGEELILDGVDLPRFQSKVFLTTGNSVIEIVNGQTMTMKTEDPAGWVTGADVKTYLRYLYILAPERKQIYKYERLANRYGPPAEYNVNGDLTGALDMSITGPVYVLRDTSDGAAAGSRRDVVKLLRGEKQTLNIRNLPSGALDNTTKIVKSSSSGNFYFLDPDGKRIVVTTNDGDLGDSLYLKQYVLDSEQVGKLKDLFVDEEDTRLYVLDDKKIYAIDLQAR
ncbi:MAG: hypothetical protein PHZ00_04490 [Candidatus Peribacteraceae bacterium]|nr:hypothetical protein [Candidatus Peribacteraceae bacterium]